MNATIIIPAASRTRAKETFSTGEYLFNVGLSASGQVPFTHYVSSGDFLDDEINTFSRGGATSFRMLAGAHGFDQIAFDFSLYPVADVPDGYVNPDKPYRVKTWAAKTKMAELMPGLCSAVETLIASIQDIGQKESAQASWINAEYFERDNPLIAYVQMQSVGTDHELTNEAIDAMFQAAWNLVPVF